MLYRAIQVAFLASAAFASSVHSPAPHHQALDEKAPNAGLCPFGPSPSVCSMNIGPYWYICGLNHYKSATDLCESYGWRLAMLTIENADVLNQLAVNCTGNYRASWVAGVHGLPADPCAYLFSGPIGTNALGGYLNQGTAVCELVLSGVICEEIPQTTISTTSTAHEGVIYTGTTITTTSIRTRTVIPFDPQCTDCPKPKPSSSSSSSSSSGETYCSSDDSSSEYCSDSSSSEWDSSSSSSSESECPIRRHHKLQKGSALIQRQTIAEPVCLTGDCLPACNVSFGGIHMITAGVNYTDTAAECAKYGWKLLDFTNGRTFDLFNVIVACTGNDFAFGYINSFNGVTSNCTYIDVFILASISASAGFPGNDSWCFDSELPVFCQEQCPFPVVESGVEPGLLSISKYQSVTFEAVAIPTSTSIISTVCTETIYARP